MNKHLIFSSIFNSEKVLKTNHSHTQISSDAMLTNNSWLTHQFTIVQRAIFILSLIVLFWIIFIIIYMTSRLILRFLSNFKHFRFYYDSPSASNEKICRAFVISSNQYGSFRPTHMPSPLLYRSDSLFSSHDLTLNNEQTTSQSSLNTPVSTTKATNTSLLEHYLKTYNPLQINLTNTNPTMITTSIVKDEEVFSDTDTRPINNCYAFHCTPKRKIHHGERYTRLKEDEQCSATMSVTNDQLSECSTHLTSITVPILMVTDCSDSQRLHTDIIELDDDDDENKKE